MITFVYSARDQKTGNKVTAEIQAQNEATAARLLHERGLTVMEIKPKNAPRSFGIFRERVSTKQRVIFSRQLATLVNAGLPLVQSLTTVEHQTPNKLLKEAIGTIINDVEAGSPLANAMAKHPKLFDSVYVSLIAAGEASGTLDVTLERLATQQEKDAEIVSRVRGALIYPLIVLVVLFAVLIFMMVAVLPQVQSLYNQLPGAKLPMITSALLTSSHWLIQIWWVIIILAFLGVFFARRWLTTPSGRESLDRFKMKSWPAGQLLMKMYMARFSRTSATLIASGVPMIKALDTTANAVGNVHLAASINRVSEAVKGGKNLSDSLKSDPNFLELVPSMVSIGEQSGALDEMLGKLADYYEKEVDNQIKTISTVIEPALMITVGVIALIIVASVLLPIYNLAGQGFVR